MKNLFLKQVSNFFGPWKSFEYNKISDLEILDSFFTKAGHPYQLILDYEMDCKIISDLVLFDWQKHFYKTNSTLQNFVAQHTEGVVDISIIDFGNYDFVYTEDPFLNKEIIFNFPETVFGWVASEHWGSSNKNVVDYDIFFDHQKKRHHIVKNRNLISFPRSQEKILNLFDSNRRNQIFLDNRTELSNYTVSLLLNEFNISVVEKSVVKNSEFYFNISTDSKESRGYYQKLANSKYTVSLNERFGQLFLDAASLNSICIGNLNKNANEIPLHPECYISNQDQLVELIAKIEADNDFHNEIIEYQNQKIKKINSVFSETIYKSKEKKKNRVYKFNQYTLRYFYLLIFYLLKNLKYVYLKFKKNKI